MQQDTRPETGKPLTGALAEIDAVLERARLGHLGETAALADIGQVVRRRGAHAETYQKPLG